MLHQVDLVQKEAGIMKDRLQLKILLAVSVVYLEL